jgi:Rrf2 family protein
MPAILNQSASYALRAVLYIARHDGAQTADCMAEKLGVPRNYLGKILHQLVRANVLQSTRGPRGGFELVDAPAATSLEQVITPFQTDAEPSVCLLGNRKCDRRRPCAAHDRWEQMTTPVARFFAQTTVADMIESEVLAAS